MSQPVCGLVQESAEHVVRPSPQPLASNEDLGISATGYVPAARRGVSQFQLLASAPTPRRHHDDR